MSFTTTLINFAIGKAVRKSHLQAILDSLDALASAAMRHDLGGDINAYIQNTTAVDLPNGSIVQINGSNLGGVGGLTAVLEITVRSKPATLAPQPTVTVDIFNVTDGAVVSSSDLSIAPSTAATSAFASKTVTLSVAGLKSYKARIRTSDGTKGVSARASIVIRK